MLPFPFSNYDCWVSGNARVFQMRFTWGISVPALLWGGAAVVRQTWRKGSPPPRKKHLEIEWSTQTPVHSIETFENSPLTVTAFWLVRGMCVSPPSLEHTTQGYAPTSTVTYIGIMQQFEWKWMGLGGVFFFLFFLFFPPDSFIYLFIWSAGFFISTIGEWIREKAPGATD